MSLRADVNPKFYWRFALIGVVSLGMAGWFLYDGSIAWPEQRVRGLKYQEIMEDTTIADGDKLNVWFQAAEEQGWPPDNPGKPRDEGEIFFQFVMSGIAAVVGVGFLYPVFASRGRWMEADDKGITTSWGQQMEFAHMVELDKRQWRNKGIARVRYEVDGKRYKMILDDCKFDRPATNKMLRQVEGILGAERIKGGPPEPPETELTAESETATASTSADS